MASEIRVELPSYSMFSATPAYQIQATVDGSTDNIAVFGLRRPQVVPDATDIRFTVPVGGENRLDKISQKFYDTPLLATVIADCNPGLDPMNGPAVADIINIPTRQRLATLGILTTNV